MRTDGVAGRIGRLDQCSLITWGAFKITSDTEPHPANSDLIVPEVQLGHDKVFKAPQVIFISN